MKLPQLRQIIREEIIKSIVNEAEMKQLILHNGLMLFVILLQLIYLMMKKNYI